MALNGNFADLEHVFFLSLFVLAEKHPVVSSLGGKVLPLNPRRGFIRMFVFRPFQEHANDSPVDL